MAGFKYQVIERHKQVNVRFSEMELEKLRQLAKDTYLSESDVIRLLILNGAPQDVLKVPKLVGIDNVVVK